MHYLCHGETLSQFRAFGSRQVSREPFFALWVSGPVWAGLGRSELVWAGLGRSGLVWAGLGFLVWLSVSGPVWAGLGKSGPVWAGLLVEDVLFFQFVMGFNFKQSVCFILLCVHWLQRLPS
jgi:hypothetical protein